LYQPEFLNSNVRKISYVIEFRSLFWGEYSGYLF